jgi:hypothetical protein
MVVYTLSRLSTPVDSLWKGGSLLSDSFQADKCEKVISLELLSQALVEKMAGWRHSGFSVHSKVRAKTKEEAEQVGRYMIRPLLSLERLSFLEKEGKVSYRYGKEGEEENTIGDPALYPSALSSRRPMSRSW